MPYRRLPNTDHARLRALNTALEKGRELPPFRLAFTQKSFQEIQSFLPAFENGIAINKQNYSRYQENGKEYQKEFRKARLYISHFIQVMNMSVQRGELPQKTREYYGLESGDKTLPPLNTDADLIKWGERVIEGETKRIQKGLSPVTNPTMAMVRVWYEKFLDAFRFQKTMIDKQNRSQSQLAQLRKRADTIIQQVWNEVEEHYRDLPDNMKREKAQDYGLIYVYRKTELQGTRLIEEERRNIG